MFTSTCSSATHYDARGSPAQTARGSDFRFADEAPSIGRFRDWQDPRNPGDARFCAEHGITSDIELIPIQQINEAYERLLKSDVNYRFVIDMASLR